MTFPPGPGPKDHFFVSYLDRESYIVVSRFSISQETGLADPGSEVVLQRLQHKEENHFAGSLAFSPLDGLLYWSTGDGKAPWDLQAQDPHLPYGKILRFNPYGEPGTQEPEIYASGLRNPWRMSFDPATGDLFIGDVGENTFEEVNLIPAKSAPGINFGWGIMEGLECYEFGNCIKDGLTLPVVVFDHDAGCSSTAGETYRGSKHPDWNGKFFYADFCLGNVWETHRDENAQWVVNKVLDRSDNAISSFGTGEDGEIYFVNYITGDIYILDAAAPMIVDPPPPDDARRAIVKKRK
jgi:glucose/arabinose dehydrogenase